MRSTNLRHDVHKHLQRSTLCVSPAPWPRQLQMRHQQRAGRRGAPHRLVGASEGRQACCCYPRLIRVLLCCCCCCWGAAHASAVRPLSQPPLSNNEELFACVRHDERRLGDAAQGVVLMLRCCGCCRRCWIERIDDHNRCGHAVRATRPRVADEELEVRCSIGCVFLEV